MSKESMCIRAFIALPIPETVKVEIERAREELRRALPEHCARWTKRDQFHLTLRFLGNVEEARVSELAAAVGAACSGFPALPLRAERIGCFPDLRFPRVVWVWVHDEADRLGDLQKAVAQATAPFAESDADKKFTGHVTIARTHGIKRSQAEILATLAHAMSGRFFGEWRADQVELMRSELLAEGARHSVVAAFGLKARGESAS
jgi:2'-5' RNA ligase